MSARLAGEEAIGHARRSPARRRASGSRRRRRPSSRRARAGGCPRRDTASSTAMTNGTPAAFAVAIAHVRRRDVRVAARRHVAAGDVDRNQPLPGEHTGMRPRSRTRGSTRACASAKRRTCARSRTRCRGARRGTIARAPLDVVGRNDDRLPPSGRASRAYSRTAASPLRAISASIAPATARAAADSVSGDFAARFRYSMAMGALRHDDSGVIVGPVHTLSANANGP